MTSEPTAPADEAFWSKVEQVEDGCWLFRGESLRYGNYRGTPAHRFAWTQAHGPIPEGMWVLHHCDHPGCVRTTADSQWPDGHLFLGTARDNSHDAVTKGRHVGGSAHDPQALDKLVGDILPSSVFRLVYQSLTKPVTVTVSGHPIATYTPIRNTTPFSEVRAEVTPERRERIDAVKLELTASERNAAPVRPGAKPGRASFAEFRPAPKPVRKTR